jgi:protein-tyrosine phosphatase
LPNLIKKAFMVRVLFVCLGNICRSPLAEGIMEKQLKEMGLDQEVEVSSAGTGTWHLGHEPDERTHSVAGANGITLNTIAEHVEDKTLEAYDYILVMDENNRSDVESSDIDGANLHKIFLMREFDPEVNELMSVPDPYMGGEADFDGVFNVLNRSITNFIHFLRQQHALSF